MVIRAQVVEKRSGSEAALEFFDRALTIEPSNKMARFRRIRALVGLKRNEASRNQRLFSRPSCKR